MHLIDFLGYMFPPAPLSEMLAGSNFHYLSLQQSLQRFIGVSLYFDFVLCVHAVDIRLVGQ